MTKQIVMWTALPNAIVGDAASRRLRLSVFVSPRLQPDGEEGPLSLFPDFVDWPAHLQPGQVSFVVASTGFVGTDPLVPAVIISPPPDSKLWTALFGASSRVRSHQSDDLTGRPVSSYSAASLHDHIKKSYQKVCATSPVHLADHTVLKKAFPDLHDAFGPPPEPRPGETPQTSTLQSIHRSLAENLYRPDPEMDLPKKIVRAVHVAKQLAGIPPGPFTEVVPQTDSAISHFAQLTAFHYRPRQETAPAPPSPEPMDFHQAVAALGEYPELMRRLGLVLDLEVPEPGFLQSPTNDLPRVLQVIPTFTIPLSGANYSPSTGYILEGDRFFLPRPLASTAAQPDAIFGLLNLQNPGQFQAIQLDVDGAALKAIHTVATQVRSTPQPDGVGDPPEPPGVPALRTSGVWIARTDWAKVLHDRFNAARTHNAVLDPPQPATFFAEDLIRGYRVDAFDSRSRRWHSLHQRRGSYTFKNHEGGPLTLNIPPEGAPPDEGAAQPALTQPPGDRGGPLDPASQLYVHESLFHWQGWSLAVPRPGKTLADAGPEIAKNPAPLDGFPLEVAFTAEPGSLPRLRFGVQYQFRARIVDLAGNSLSLNDADGLLEFLRLLGRPAPVLPASLTDPKASFTYRRFEPVVSPVLVPREKFTEGESIERLVIRSNAGESATAYAAALTSRVAFRAMYNGVNERHVVPPKTSLWMVEALGRLDDAFGTRPGEPPEEFTRRCARTYSMARKEKGRLNDVGIIDIETGMAVPIPATTGVDPRTGATISRPSVEFVVTNQDHRYALHHESQLRLPYLPDPLARGATLFGLPGLPPGQAAELDPRGNLVFLPSNLPPATIAGLGSITQIAFGPDDAWPELKPFRMQLVEPDGPASPLAWDPATRVLSVPLAKAEQATIRLSSFLKQEDLDLLAIWKWMLDWNADQGLPPPDAGVVQTALAGAFWMLTPFHELTLVHAVQQPLTEPKIRFLEQFPDEVFAASDRGRTFALLMGEAEVHGNSTMKLDLLASWDEPIDRIEQSKPSTITAHAHVGELPVHLPGQPPIEAEAGNIPSPPPSPEQLRFLLITKPGVRYAPAKQAVQFGGIRHEFGDTKHRKVRYQVVGTTRFREYFPPEVTEDASNISRTSELPVEIDILSTSRPAAPRLLYVLPTFGWQKQDDTSTGVKTSKRLGGGLRIYLERPWVSSGEGELLGVVLETDAGSPPNELLQPYVTHWGRDPIWQSNPTSNPPTPAHFKRGVEIASGLSLEEVGGSSTVTVVGHAVNFDENRKLWYCDIEIDVGTSYFPFVRLALARYQPKSIQNAHLSHVVVADFVQLAPNRTVTLSPEPGNPNLFNISVVGLTYGSNSWHAGTTEAPFENDPVFEFRKGSLGHLLPGEREPGATLLPDHAIRGVNGLVEVNPAPDLISVSVEERISGTIDDAGWQPARPDPMIKVEATSAVKAGSQRDSSTPLWTGRVTLPGSRALKQFRVVTREFEHLHSDAASENTFALPTEVPFDPDDGPVLHGQGFRFRGLSFVPGTGRLVFADTIEL